MGTAVIIVVLLVIVCISLKSSLRHFAGQGGCCGGGADAPKKLKKRLKGVITQTQKYEVAGMHCDNCKVRVENSINELSGLVGKVSMNDKTLEVQGERAFTREEISDAVHRAGYELL